MMGNVNKEPTSDKVAQSFPSLYGTLRKVEDYCSDIVTSRANLALVKYCYQELLKEMSIWQEATPHLLEIFRRGNQKFIPLCINCKTACKDLQPHFTGQVAVKNALDNCVGFGIASKVMPSFLRKTLAVKANGVGVVYKKNSSGPNYRIFLDRSLIDWDGSTPEPAFTQAGNDANGRKSIFQYNQEEETISSYAKKHQL